MKKAFVIKIIKIGEDYVIVLLKIPGRTNAKRTGSFLRK
jgi:hypothetical protein